jgi:DNA invertase Pin-like site-specific DNA recombinase
MAYALQPPLQARSGHSLVVLAICRISTTKQDERSLADQEALYRSYLAQHTDLPFQLTVIAGQGSGEALDRKEYFQAVESVESGRFDLVITEDLGRICRRVNAHLFCELCEDSATRLIAINDHVDTAREDWRLSSFFAVMRHETYNKDTGQRIRRSLRNRFQNGGVFQFEIYGYIKPPDASSDTDVRKEPSAEPVYDEWFRLLESGASYSEVADWLNTQRIAPGPYARSAKWDGKMVQRVTSNPILKGVRVRNRKISKRVNRTGRRKSVNAPPDELLERQCPHLAFIEPERYDRVIRLLRVRNRKYRRREVDGRDPRANVSKKRTRWPGQQIYCSICGRMFVYGGHGQRDHLMCSGARGYQCWNAITCDGPLAASKLTRAVLDELTSLPEFDDEFRNLIREEAARLDARRRDGVRDAEKQLERIDREIAHVVRAIREIGSSASLLEELRRLETEKADLLRVRDEARRIPERQIELPSVDEIRRMFQEAIKSTDLASPEFGRLMQRVLPRIHVFPVRLVDGGHPVLRARVELNLGQLTPQLQSFEPGLTLLNRQLTVDLFDPPQREQFRRQVVDLRASGRTEREVARELGITVTAVQRAAALARKMEVMGLADAYVPVTAPPGDYAKLRRHHHGRYEFAPLDGFPLAGSP